ncbi:MAG: iron-sulfur cluster assembly scaffold protein [Candidatus Aenigmatarchaeota archaeon]|nr:MAG: iron-sulfur cluster assembly scaffold protein [Candidatus Aenigmarchaeota archaeon]RLJ07559.1 MAG: iron-sulfur cluster assembly scaffold protein [Candidatus Aenigmarchaeota archaeon]RLJ09374.1 MAG: iron-sulfur cluster assembly scaffold protein [Candidatus Aenigmarchaeota archaeon]
MFNKELLKKSGFSDKAVRYITENKNYGEMNNATVKGSHTGTCGDTIIIYLKLEGDVIKDASFIYTGCAGSAAAGSAITELVKGKTTEKASKLSLKDIIEFYKEGEKGLPEFKYDCGNIAVAALKDALKKVDKFY